MKALIWWVAAPTVFLLIGSGAVFATFVVIDVVGRGRWP